MADSRYSLFRPTAAPESRATVDGRPAVGPLQATASTVVIDRPHELGGFDARMRAAQEMSELEARVAALTQQLSAARHIDLIEWSWEGIPQSGLEPTPLRDCREAVGRAVDAARALESASFFELRRLLSSAQALAAHNKRSSTTLETNGKRIAAFISSGSSAAAPGVPQILEWTHAVLREIQAAVELPADLKAIVADVERRHAEALPPTTSQQQLPDRGLGRTMSTGIDVDAGPSAAATFFAYRNDVKRLCASISSMWVVEQASIHEYAASLVATTCSTVAGRLAARASADNVAPDDTAVATCLSVAESILRVCAMAPNDAHNTLAPLAVVVQRWHERQQQPIGRIPPPPAPAAVTPQPSGAASEAPSAAASNNTGNGAAGYVRPRAQAAELRKEQGLRRGRPEATASAPGSRGSSPLQQSAPPQPAPRFSAGSSLPSAVSVAAADRAATTSQAPGTNAWPSQQASAPWGRPSQQGNTASSQGRPGQQASGGPSPQAKPPAAPAGGRPVSQQAPPRPAQTPTDVDAAEGEEEEEPKRNNIFNFFGLL
jgi:hypothetical protein